MSKKCDFLLDPPLWLTDHWLTLLPTTIRNEIWTADEMLELQESINHVNIHLEQIVTRAKNSLFHKDDDPPEMKENLSINGGQGNLEHGLAMGNSNSEKMKHPDCTSLVRSSVSSGVIGVASQIREGGRSPHGNSLSRLEGGTEDDNEKRIRQQIAVKTRRRSSITKLFRNFVPRPVLKLNTKLEDLAAPIFINDFLKRATTMSIQEVNEAITSVVCEDFAVALIEKISGDDDDNFPALLIGALIKYLRDEEKRNKQTSNVIRTVIAAFFEVGDEVSDFVLAILFMIESGNLKWAAILMFVFMGLNRAMAALFSYIKNEPLVRCAEALIGIKTITDTYRILTHGKDNSFSEQELKLVVQSRMYTLGIGLALESLPQMVLQLSIVMAEMKSSTLDQGILAAQITSILASCSSIGFSFASLSIDNVRSLYNSHPIIVFLANIDEDISTFLFSTTNWKETLRDELWDIPMHSSLDWGIPELVGDHDANHAAHISAYMSCDLPWKKITTWLQRKKAAFLESPPLWMTPEWFDNLTPEVKRNVWSQPGELEELITKVKEVCAKAKEQ
eukprot:g2393.t1